MSERMAEHMPDNMPGNMTGGMPDNLWQIEPDRMLENMSASMSEYMIDP